jgi:hypothetical protein
MMQFQSLQLPSIDEDLKPIIARFKETHPNDYTFRLFTFINKHKYSNVLNYNVSWTENTDLQFANRIDFTLFEIFKFNEIDLIIGNNYYFHTYFTKKHMENYDKSLNYVYSFDLVCFDKSNHHMICTISFNILEGVYNMFLQNHSHRKNITFDSFIDFICTNDMYKAFLQIHFNDQQLQDSYNNMLTTFPTYETTLFKNIWAHMISNCWVHFIKCF